MKNLLRNLLVVVVVSFIFQITWEYGQCDIFYTMDDLTNHTRLMLSATFGDVMMTIALYALLTLVNRDPNWIIKDWDYKEFVIIALYSLFLSFYFEASALHTGRWGYKSTMPLFPNTDIALIPVIQLLILFPLSFAVSRLIIKKWFR